MTEYVTSVISVEDGKPVFETVSSFDGKIVAWSEEDFACFLSVAQNGEVVFVADEPNDLARIGSLIMEEDTPKLCLMERVFFESHFDAETRIIGRKDKRH